VIAQRGLRAATLGLMLFASACGSNSDDGTTGLPQAAEVKISAPATELFVGQSVQLSAVALDASGNDVAAGEPVWSSSNDAVARVSESGLLTALSAGTVSLRAALGGKTANMNVTVEDLPGYNVTVQVTSLFAPASVSVRQFGTVSFVFNGTQQNVTFSTAFPGAPTNIANTSMGTVNRQFNTVGDFRYESSLTAGLAGFVRVR
jgi:trimeric autotransporter adhesin